jgi:tripartite-type tricarboxylate transporter receptor subunit TctC
MRALGRLGVLIWLGLLASIALAQGFPSKPVRLVVPFAPGGTNDIAARSIAPELSEALGEQVIVENRAGAGGQGTTSHLIAELFAITAGVKLLIVPYKGAGPALVDLLGGDVDARVDQISSSIEHIKSNRLRAVAVTTARRAALLPDLPTLGESGLPGFDASTVNGVLAPAATPPDVVRRLNAALVKALSMPAIIERFRALGVELRPSSSEELASFIREDLAKWKKVVRETGLILD